jgi:Carboxypeptidase regulatory-like domain
MALSCLAVSIALGGLSSRLSAQQKRLPVFVNTALPDEFGLVVGPDDTGQQKAGPQRPVSTPATEKGAANISGTVLDTNGNVIQGARVVLSNKAGTDERELQSGANGEFEFSTLAPGIYKLTVTGRGMGTFVSPTIPMRAGEMRFVSEVVLPVAATSTSVSVTGNKEELAEEQVQIAVEQRVLGVFPNFYTTFDSNAPPMGTKQKYKLALRSMIDPVTFAGAGALAGFEQFYDIFPGYGGGIQGYVKRYGAAYANDFSARMLSSAVFASLFRQDPRYFYKGTGSIRFRTMYAISAAVIAKDDNGHRRPNYSHVLGTFLAGAISNLYYPSSSHGLSLTLTNGLVETAGRAGTNLLREFVLKGITSRAGGKP